MKQLKYLLLFWLLPISLLANYIHWLGDYNSALQLAQKEHKPLLVLVVKKDDNSSSKIIANSFINRDYIDEINQKIVSVIVTYEGKISYPIEMYYTTTFPILFLVNTETETFIKEPLYGEQITPKALLQYFQSYLSEPT